MGLFRKIRQGIFNYSPSLGVGYRSYRQHKHLSRCGIRKIPLGFMFGGNTDMQAGSFEPEETELIQQYLHDASLFVDIGANVGFFSCIGRKMGKKVIAVEPCIQNLDFLLLNLNANGWTDVEVVPLCMGKEAGLTTIYGWGTGASILKSWAGWDESQQSLVPITTLDILLGDRFQMEQIVIKVDVEGAEFSVLKGALNTLRRSPSPVWLMEICLTEHSSGGMNPDFLDIFKVFWEQGYVARTVGKEQRIVTAQDVERWVRNRSRDFGSINYLFEKR